MVTFRKWFIPKTRCNKNKQYIVLSITFIVVKSEVPTGDSDAMLEEFSGMDVDGLVVINHMGNLARAARKTIGNFLNEFASMDCNDLFHGERKNGNNIL